MSANVLGRTGVVIPSAFLGCGTFGGIGGATELIGRGLDEDAAFAAMDDAVAVGIDVFDTAERYAAGASERTIGDWLRQRPAELTAKVRLATKVAPPSADGDDDSQFDRPYIETKLRTSLDRLGVGGVTFYLSHATDDSTPIESTLEGFEAVRDAGLVGHVGCCNVGAGQLRAALDAAERLGVTGFEWVQNGFSLLSPDDDSEVRSLCRERGLGYTPFSPLAGGVLTGKYRRGEPFPDGTRLSLRPEGYDELLTRAAHDAIDRLRSEAKTRGVSTAALALAWVLQHRDCTAAVIGPSRTAPALAHVAEAMTLSLSPDEHDLLADWFRSIAARPGGD